MRKYKKLLLWILLLSVVFFIVVKISIKNGLGLIEKGTVIRVIDGDTITVSIGGDAKVVRLIGVDAPESVDPELPIECFANEASLFTKELLLGKEIILRRDYFLDNRDIYGRLLRYVYLGEGENFNLMLIEGGYAEEYFYKGRKYFFRDIFVAAENEAVHSKVGLWMSCRD